MKKTPIFIILICAAAVILVVHTAVAEESRESNSAGTGPSGKSDTGAPAASQQEASMDEINKQMNNPVSDLWFLTMQYNHVWLNGDLVNKSKNADILVFQPVLPLKLTKEWNLINRPNVPFIVKAAAPSEILDENGTAEIDFDHVGGMGDTTLLSLVTPSAARQFIWGVGPTLNLPTATDKRLGSGKWSAGPAGFAGYITDKMMVGILPQHQWSYAGWGGDHVNESNIQYFMQLFLPEMWQVGVGNPTVHIDWTAGGGDKVTFPVGLNVAKMVKVGKTPVKLWLGGYYMPIRPDGYGEEWSVRFQISPTMPALIKGYLLE